MDWIIDAFADDPADHAHSSIPGTKQTPSLHRGQPRSPAWLGATRKHRAGRQPGAREQGHCRGDGLVRRDRGSMAKALGARPRGPGQAGASAQALARSGRRTPGRPAASGLSGHVHAGANLPDFGGGLRKTAGTPQPLDAPGIGAGSHPPGHRGADFRNPRRSLFKIRGISSRTGPAIG
jgi:hypothetical protein